MNRDEIRKLIGGYATGTLTDAEQKLLFEAVLEDQELFDELAREQELKELIELPGVRTRLIAALGPAPAPARAWWKNPWPWAAAATLAMGIVVAVAVWPRPHSEMASNRGVTTTPAVAQDRPPATAAPALNPEAKASPSVRQRDEVRRREVMPVAPAPAGRRDEPKKAADKAVDKTEIAEKDAAARAERASTPPPASAIAPPPPPPVAAPAAPPQVQAATGATGGTVGRFLPGESPVGTPQSQAIQQAQSNARPASQQEQARIAQVTQDVIAGRLAREPQNKNGQPAGFASASAAKAQVAPRFAFAYRFDPSGYLEITPATDGFLIVNGFAADKVDELYPRGAARQLTSNIPIRINLPEQVTAVNILFSALNVARDYKVETYDQNALKKDAPSKNPNSGVVEDPTPSPNSRLSITLPVPKRN